MRDVIEHYNKLIDENNDPARDPKPLRDYMDKWDGEKFIESMQLDKSKSALEYSGFLLCRGKAYHRT